MCHQQKDCNCFRGIYKLLCFEPPFVNFISPQLSKYLIHCPNLDERTDKTLITASHLPLHKKNNKRVSWNVELLLHNFTIWVYCLWQMLPQSDCIVSAHVSPWVLGGYFLLCPCPTIWSCCDVIVQLSWYQVQTLWSQRVPFQNGSTISCLFSAEMTQLNDSDTHNENSKTPRI